MNRIARTLPLALLALAFALVGRSNAFGQTAEKSYSGFHISAMGFQNALAGHFDGDHFFESGGALYIVPKLATSLGYGVGFGVRRGEMDADFYYGQSTHDYTFPLWDNGRAKFSFVGFDYKFFLIPKGIIQPFVGMEFAFTWLKVEKGSVMETAPFRTADNTFSGLTIGAGGGLAVYPIPAVGLFGMAVFSWETFGNMKGVGGDRMKLDKLDSLNFNLRFGVTIRFLKSIGD